MKKETTEPSRKHTLQAIVDYLVDNGVTNHTANIIIHTNNDVLNGSNIVDVVREGRWDDAWGFAQLYIEGDLW